MACVAIALTATASAAAATRPVPQGFMGMNAAGPVFNGDSDMKHEFALMAQSNVESMRFAVYWANAQPYRSFVEVPSGDRRPYTNEHGVPTDYSGLDRAVTQAAKRHLRITVVLIQSPAWAAKHPESDHSQPASTSYRALARFAAALVRRYGSNGSFWDDHPKLPRRPIRNWEAWNEPDINYYWDPPFAQSYVAMLKKVAPAIRKADDHARVVLASLTNESWTHVQSIYSEGGRSFFDVAAINPYSKQPSGVVHIAELFRDTMKKNGDSKKPILVTEMSWTSAQGKVSFNFGWETTESGQADRLREGYERFAATRCRLRIESVSWETWMTYDQNNYSFDYAGLRQAFTYGRKPRSKPALEAYVNTAKKLEQRGKDRAKKARCA